MFKRDEIIDYYKEHERLSRAMPRELEVPQNTNNPIPYWSVILLSAIGTFLSVMFGDELLDRLTDRTFYNKHKNKHRLIIFIVLILLIIIIYEHLITEMVLRLNSDKLHTHTFKKIFVYV